MKFGRDPTTHNARAGRRLLTPATGAPPRGVRSEALRWSSWRLGGETGRAINVGRRCSRRRRAAANRRPHRGARGSQRHSTGTDTTEHGDKPIETVSTPMTAPSTGAPSSKGWGVPVLTDVLREMTKNQAMRIPAIRAARLRRPRAGAHFTGTREELERYAFQSLRSMLAVVGPVRGLDIVELGPGDSLTSGFSLLAAGANSYTAIDRFSGDYSAAHSKDWYRGIRDHWPEHFSDIPWPENLDPDRFPDDYGDIVRTIPTAIESVELTKSFDVVCSYQVGEHVDDLDAFALLTGRLLRSKGTAVHRVDFGPHDCWLDYADPLTFLRFPEWLWSLMGSNRGYPNRHRHYQFLEAFERAALDIEVQDLEVFRPSDTANTRLARRFRPLDRRLIDIQTAVYVCRHR